MPSAPPRPPQPRDRGPLGQAELRENCDVYYNTPPHALVDTLRRHFQGLHPNRRFAVALLPHGAGNVYVRQLQTKLTPGERVVDDLVDVWIWWFNLHQPDQGRMWVPHLSWMHTIIAPPTERRPAPSAGSREWAAPQLRASALRILPYNDLAAWKSRTAPERGRNFQENVERYAAGPER